MSTLSKGNISQERGRILSIDILRGIIMIMMLLDHVRETFFLHAQVPDPMVPDQTSYILFYSRFLAHFCAPTFVLLTGLSAYLYASKKANPKKEASLFLLKRGIFLVLLELTLINFAWTFEFPPTRIYLQVIWVIGLSMISLSAILWLPRKAILALSVILIAFHNLLDSISFPPDHILYVPWAILHDRGWIIISDSMKARTSYPLLPWIGIISLGYFLGPLYRGEKSKRLKSLLTLGVSFLVIFFVVRFLNFYGEKPWEYYDKFSYTLMSFFNITKYPPSFLFIMLTLGGGFLALYLLEKFPSQKMEVFSVYGSVPMFFYLVHLYLLKLMYLVAVSIWGLNQGEYFGVNHMSSIWLIAIAIAVALYWPMKAFSAFKGKRRDLTWLKYL